MIGPGTVVCSMHVLTSQKYLSHPITNIGENHHSKAFDSSPQNYSGILCSVGYLVGFYSLVFLT